MHIDEILARVECGERPLVPESWGQGRTTFGGLTGAILCQALMAGVDSDRVLRNLDVSFVRPFEALKPYNLDVEEFANGKTVCIKQVRLVQDGKIRAVAKGDFVRMLESAVHIDTFIAPNLPAIADSRLLVGDDLPDFFGMFEAYVATKGMPFSGTDVPELGGWMRFNETPVQLTESHLVCLIDSWPPTASPFYEGFKPLSTVSWSIHFANPVTTLASDSFVGYHSKVNFGEGGISSSSAEIWAPEGKLLAKSVQTSIIYG